MQPSHCASAFSLMREVWDCRRGVSKAEGDRGAKYLGLKRRTIERKGEPNAWCDVAFRLVHSRSLSGFWCCCARCHCGDATFAILNVQQYCKLRIRTFASTLLVAESLYSRRGRVNKGIAVNSDGGEQKVGKFARRSKPCVPRAPSASRALPLSLIMTRFSCSPFHGCAALSETKGLLGANHGRPTAGKSALTTPKSLKFALGKCVRLPYAAHQAAACEYLIRPPPLPISNPFSRHPG